MRVFVIATSATCSRRSNTFIVIIGSVEDKYSCKFDNFGRITVKINNSNSQSNKK